MYVNKVKDSKCFDEVISYIKRLSVKSARDWPVFSCIIPGRHICSQMLEVEESELCCCID